MNKPSLSRANGRFKYVIFDAQGNEYSTANTYYHAAKDGKECKGEVWLNGRMVQNYAEKEA